MKAFLNPLLLVICILLLVFGYASAASGDEGGFMVDTWVLTLCLLGIIINGTLGVARALTSRPAVPLLGWAVGYLIFGSVVWGLVSGEPASGVSAEERRLLQERVAAWQGGQMSPFAVDEHGDCVLSLAAGLGKEELVADLLADAGANAWHQEALLRAFHRAAECNRDQVLRQLHAAGVSADARLQDMTPLHAAALAKARRAAACLLELGASVNATTADGATPLHQAVLAEDAQMVRLLLQHGADPTLLDADGRDAASYARSEAISEALAPAPQEAPEP